MYFWDVTNSKACRFLDIKNNVIFESIDTEFYEDRFPFKSRYSGGSQPLIILPSRPIDSRVHDRDNEIELETRRSKTTKLSKDFGPDFYTSNLEGDPSCLEDALTSLEAKSGEKLFKMKCTIFYQIIVRNLLIYHMGVKLYEVNGSLGKSLNPMVLLKNTRLD